VVLHGGILAGAWRCRPEWGAPLILIIMPIFLMAVCRPSISLAIPRLTPGRRPRGSDQGRDFTAPPARATMRLPFPGEDEAVTAAKDKPVLLTGASGNLGRMLARELAASGWTLRLTDIAPFPDAVPPKASFTKADLNDGVTILRLAEGCQAILHFGGISSEHPFEVVLGPNIRGLYHVYEGARREKARVLFASSNHSIGFHERPMGNQERLDADCAFRPDGFYGLSKAYGELMGRLYWDKHGVENLNVRIGSSFPEPVDARMLSTWLSYPDLAGLVEKFLEAPRIGHAVVWGASDNPTSYWGADHRDRIGWKPKDTAERYRDQVGGKVSGDPVTERYQGGGYPAMDYTREKPSPRDAFSLD
jgi:uronate dehydrogenase